jgi:hypothetical protein
VHLPATAAGLRATLAAAPPSALTQAEATLMAEWLGRLSR